LRDFLRKNARENGVNPGYREMREFIPAMAAREDAWPQVGNAAISSWEGRRTGSMTCRLG
jgi:hypothetical protein